MKKLTLEQAYRTLMHAYAFQMRNTFTTDQDALENANDALEIISDAMYEVRTRIHTLGR